MKHSMPDWIIGHDGKYWYLIVFNKLIIGLRLKKILQPIDFNSAKAGNGIIHEKGTRRILCEIIKYGETDG